MFFKNAQGITRALRGVWHGRYGTTRCPLLMISCVAVVLRLLGLVNPFIFQAIIDRILPFQRIESLYAIVVLMVSIMLFSTALSTLSGYLGAYLANRLTLEFGRRIYTHLLSLSLPTLRTWQVGELFSRIGKREKYNEYG
ncbi:ABC transporter transmembrane domain-containing protein [Bartonella sp. AU18XJBT]|uniref:ABC transporter transmembrane domain-containing protein n=1 Tax=Bartonella sp. AU18XJBT TaxID=3019089 RepID=UPI00235F4118